MTGVDRSNKPESVVALLGGNARLVFALATALLLAGGGLLFWLLQSAVRRCAWHGPQLLQPPLVLVLVLVHRSPACAAVGPLASGCRTSTHASSESACVPVLCCAWLSLKCTALAAAALTQGNPLAPKMLYAAIAMGYIYQGPPFRWEAAVQGSWASCAWRCELQEQHRILRLPRGT